MSRIVFCIMAILLSLPLSSPAAPAITCHCFTDRSFNPSRPALADPYFLATTQNSFFAELFSVDKGLIVMKKQAGSSADDLWIAFWVGSRTGSTGEALLAMRNKKGSWKEAIASLRLPAKSIGERFAADVAGGASSARLAQEIVDGVLIRQRLLKEQDLAVLRGERATNQEVIITALIAGRSGRKPVQLYRDVKSGIKSWGAYLNEAGIQPDSIQPLFAAALKSSPR